MGRQVHFEIDLEIEQALDQCQRRYQISTDADVFRFAVMVLAASPMLTIAPQPLKPRGRPRKNQSPKV